MEANKHQLSEFEGSKTLTITPTPTPARGTTPTPNPALKVTLIPINLSNLSEIKN